MLILSSFLTISLSCLSFSSIFARSGVCACARPLGLDTFFVLWSSQPMKRIAPMLRKNQGIDKSHFTPLPAFLKIWAACLLGHSIDVGRP